MITQYQIVTKFIQMLGESCLGQDCRLRLELLFYRLKILLLGGEERLGERGLTRLCPLDELEELRILLVEARTPEGATMVAGWIEDGTMRIIDRLEAGMLQVSVSPESGEAPVMAKMPKRVSTDISNPGE